MQLGVSPSQPSTKVTAAKGVGLFRFNLFALTLFPLSYCNALVILALCSCGKTLGVRSKRISASIPHAVSQLTTRIAKLDLLLIHLRFLNIHSYLKNLIYDHKNLHC